MKRLFKNDPPETELIIRELFKPQNRDLLFAVLQIGDEDAAQSFMFGFTQRQTVDFDTFASMTHLLDVQLSPELELEPDHRSMSERYDEYLALIDQHNDRVSLTESQTTRFNALVDQFDNGWSGAYYGILMRRVQGHLRRMFNG